MRRSDGILTDGHALEADLGPPGCTELPSGCASTCAAIAFGASTSCSAICRFVIPTAISAGPPPRIRGRSADATASAGRPALAVARRAGRRLSTMYRGNPAAAAGVRPVRRWGRRRGSPPPSLERERRPGRAAARCLPRTGAAYAMAVFGSVQRTVLSLRRCRHGRRGSRPWPCVDGGQRTGDRHGSARTGSDAIQPRRRSVDIIPAGVRL